MTIREKQAEFLVMVSKLIAFCAITGVRVFVNEWYRTPERQRELVKQGKSQTYNSKHLKGLAVDLVILEGKTPIWDFERYRPLGEYWEHHCGGIWGGSWETLRDGVHFEHKERK
jgi:peptidoglycan LD-endopeptidase CwlK